MFDISDAKKLTTVFIFVMIGVTIIYDIIIYKTFGSDATISRITYKAAASHPFVSFLFGLGVGMLLSHLVWAQVIKVANEEIKQLANQVEIQQEQIDETLDK